MDPFTIMAIGTLAGAAVNYFGQESANDTNRDIAHHATNVNIDEANKNREFQQASANQQMRFQEQMSSSAYQRGAEDLRRAGLNPILALGNPATSPAGQNASGSAATAATTNVQNSMEGFATTAREVMHLKQAAQQLEMGKQGMVKGQAEIDLLKDTQKKVKADTAKTRTEERVLQKGIPEAELKNDIMDIFRPHVKKLKEGAQKNWKAPWSPSTEERKIPNWAR